MWNLETSLEEWCDILKSIWRLDEALAEVKRHLVPVDGHRVLPLEESLGKIAAVDYFATSAIPHFRRSTMDGYAVVAAATSGASESIPAMLNKHSPFPLAWERVLTGEPISAPFDAVVMLEYVEELSDGTILVNRAAAVGENIMEVGEDISIGTMVLGRGGRISSSKIGVLATQGLSHVLVRDFRVAVISSGNEVVPLSCAPRIGEVRDINSHLLVSICRAEGFKAANCGIVKDDPESLNLALVAALKDFDAVLLSGGSSAGAADYTEAAINRLGCPGVLVHGLAVRPGKPTVLGAVDGKPILGLPGHPLSCAVMAEVAVLPLLRYVAGCLEPEIWNQSGELSRSLVSAPGRRDFIPVKLAGRQVVPLLTKSAAIQALAESDGLLIIPEECEGYNTGHEVVVQRWRTQ